MDRERFLDRVRGRLTAPPPDNLPHPRPRIDVVPPIRYTIDLSDPCEAFTKKAARAGMEVRRARVPDVLAELLHTHDIRSTVVSADPECDGAGDWLRSAGVEVVPFDPRGPMQEADLGVTGAAWAVAATGSLLVDAGRAGGRAASLLPPVHLAIARSDRILPSTSDVWRRFDELWPDGPPSQLVWISGPSRSADIELTLTMGVHGPKAVWAAIVD